MDYVLVYSIKDQEQAINTNEKLKSYGLTGCLYTDLETETYDCKVKFFLVSNNLTDENEEKTYIKMKHDAFENKDVVIPIWLVRKADIHYSTSRVLYGLMPIQGIYLHCRYFEDCIEKVKILCRE